MSDIFTLTATWREAINPGTRDVAEIRLQANQQALTRIVDLERREERGFVRGSAVSLATWFADNWWRLRYESLPDGSPPSVNWRLRHELTSASGGVLWPPLMIHSTGDRVLLTPTFGGAVDVGSLRYILPEVQPVTAASYEAGLDNFFREVIGNCAAAADAAVIEALTNTLADERGDPAIASWRRLEARLGYDPDTIPDGVMREFEQLEATLGEAELGEAAAATPGRKAPNILRSVVDAAKASEIAIDLGVVEKIQLDELGGQEMPPWKLGRAAARRVREVANLSRGPIKAQAFSDLMGSTAEELRRPGTARALPYGARLEKRGSKFRIALQSADQRDRRFELSCALGDGIWTQSAFGIVSKAKTDRQKFQRAFAQNLLVPYSDLRERIDVSNLNESEITSSAKQFHVHPNVVRRLLILEGALPEETFEERLEAA